MNRNLFTADVFAELSEQAKSEAIYESDFWPEVLSRVIPAFLDEENALADLGQAVLICIDDYLREQVDAEMADDEPVDYPREHDAAHASGLIDHDNAVYINKRGSLDRYL